MTKSRTALLILAPLAAAWPGASRAAPAPPTAEEAIAAYEADFHAVMGSAVSPGRRACPAAAQGDEDIVVCGRDDSARYRVSDEPPAGARVRLVAGEAPSAIDALSVGDACCGGGGGLDVIAIARTLGRGVDRLLHPY